MTHVFKCWCPDDGDESDAEDVTVGGPLDSPGDYLQMHAMTAAEEFVEKRWSDFDHSEAIRVNVRDAADVLTEWTVVASSEVSFNAQRMGGKP